MKVLDTDILIAFLRSDRDAVNKLAELERNDIAISVFSWQELLLGPAIIGKMEEYKAALEMLVSYNVLNYETEDTFYAVKTLAYLKNAGKPIGLIDVMIAAVCLRHNAVLVTRNARHFSRIPKLKVEAW